MSGLAVKSDCGKMWAQFKLDFATAHRDLRLTNQTAHQSGFHSANMMIEQGRENTMQETVDTIAQLATATASASDRGTAATRNRSHIDHDQCQVCNSTRGCPIRYCATQGRGRGPKK
jgi:hypothetical protein